MWILIATYCGAFATGEQCYSKVPSTFYVTEVSCNVEAENARIGISKATSALKGELIYFDTRCVKIARGENI